MVSEPLPPHPVLPEYYKDAEQRREKIDQLFDAIASDYDWITSVLSLGSGRLYRHQALRRAGCTTGQKVLDVGAGTGVISLLAQDILAGKGRWWRWTPAGAR